MSKTTRKRYGTEFKAKVALEAIRGELTLSQLGAKYGVHQTLINAWKKQAVENLSTVFESRPDSAGQAREADIEKLHAKIGQLIVERDFLAKAFGR
jgi:transposase